MSMDNTEFRDMPVVDKLRLVTQLWDDIATSSEPIVVPPEVNREGMARGAGDLIAAAIATELAQRIDDRLLAVVPREIDTHVAMPQRAAATARRCPDTPPCSRRSACKRIVQTWRACPWVKPIAPES